MIKILATADLHLKMNEALGFKTIKGINDRLIDKYKIFSNIVNKAKELKVDYLFILGDVFHSINPTELLRSLFFSTIESALKEGINVVYVVGNHSTENWNVHNLLSESFIFNEFVNAESGKFITISSPTDFILKNKDGESINVLILPEAKQQDIEESINSSVRNYVFGHLPIQSGKIGKGIFALNFGYSVDLFSKFKAVFLGHFHEPQNINNCFYTGSPFANTLNEIDYDKSIMLINLPTIDTENGNYQRITIKDTINFIEQNIDINNGINKINIVKDINFKSDDNKKNLVILNFKGDEASFLQNKLFIEEVKKYIREQINNLYFLKIKIILKSKEQSIGIQDYENKEGLHNYIINILKKENVKDISINTILTYINKAYENKNT